MNESVFLTENSSQIFLFEITGTSWRAFFCVVLGEGHHAQERELRWKRTLASLVRLLAEVQTRPVESTTGKAYQQLIIDEH